MASRRGTKFGLVTQVVHRSNTPTGLASTNQDVTHSRTCEPARLPEEKEALHDG